MEIAAGYNHTCARLMDGSVRCWGYNTPGQLGDGSTTDRTSPVTVTGLSNVVEITAGDNHTCARLMDGSVRCWGYNRDGQLGDGSTTNRTSPVTVPGLSNAVEIAGGRDNTCARLMDGSVRCWGSNTAGQLGDGSTTDRTSPTAVSCFTPSTTPTCPMGQTNCAAAGMPLACFDTATSVGNCGGCGRACALANVATHTCAAGACGVVTCAPNFGNCDAMAANGCETNTLSSAAHCGACNNACMAGQMCVSGACASSCTMTTCGGACVNTQTDTAHCGACARACALANVATHTCAAGACGVVTCAPNFGNCDAMAANGCETNTLSSAAHCGACNNVCLSGQTCTAGVCTGGMTCPLGQTSCGGACLDLQTDRAHCGACGVACGSGQTCTGGVCRITCASPRVVCGAGSLQSCIDTTSDNIHCGGCATVCSADQVCASSACTTACAAPRTTCGGACVDTATDRNHCGTCGRACATGQDCAAGTCVGAGTLRMTLTWTTPGDMDLHVVPPCGTEIFYGTTMACGGTLDVDDTSRSGPENITWSGTFPSGRYLICPEAFTSAVADATWTLNVVRGGITVHTSTGVRGRTDGHTPCSATFPGVITLDL
ncbi:MAG: hypothetical protein KA978_09040 [Deltaproteobacteria bacterium]|nr:hypothetical protein [Deltaproteobacteria bacterium]